MFSTQTQSTQALPSVYVTEADFEILSNLADAAAGRAPGGRVLAGEMARAVIVEPGEPPRPFVRIGSRVAFQDLSNDQTRIVHVSLPRDASIDEARISVLSPVGAAKAARAASACWPSTPNKDGFTHAWPPRASNIAPRV